MEHFLQEQLRDKTKVNFVRFDTEAVAWKEKLARVNEESLEEALLWVNNLEVNIGTKSTLRKCE